MLLGATTSDPNRKRSGYFSTRFSVLVARGDVFCCLVPREVNLEVLHRSFTAGLLPADAQCVRLLIMRCCGRPRSRIMSRGPGDSLPPWEAATAVTKLDASSHITAITGARIAP
jgi:hypothetical protein